MKKFLYLDTMGCQMNVYDSEQITKRLRMMDFETVSSPEKADLIIVNTCAIREKAAHKAFSRLGRLSEAKRRNPDLIIAVGGCVAQQQGEKMLDRLPYLDLVFGTHAIDRLPGRIEEITRCRKRIVDVAMTGVKESLPVPEIRFGGAVSRFVTIMRGCDNFCSYCVVPFVRGREESRPPESILAEIRSLVDSGIREVTLLGQNVNSFGRKEGWVTFSELLAKVNAIQGLCRIRFTTSHPKDLSPELIEAFRSLDKLCNHIHLPIQSGSNSVLNRMNRKYTREDYLGKIGALRARNPDIAVTADVIVGFPGESASDFEDTLSLIREVEYDSLFSFKYSDRPHTPAAAFEDKIPEAVKQERLSRLLQLQSGITLKRNRRLVGSVVEILVEGFSRRQNRSETPGGDISGSQWTGRTSTNKVVNFDVGKNTGDTEEIRPGNLLRIRIEAAFPNSLWGRPVKFPSKSGRKGDPELCCEKSASPA